MPDRFSASLFIVKTLHLFFFRFESSLRGLTQSIH